jgi:hypothetical protein
MKGKLGRRAWTVTLGVLVALLGTTPAGAGWECYRCGQIEIVVCVTIGGQTTWEYRYQEFCADNQYIGMNECQVSNGFCWLSGSTCRIQRV